MLTQENFKLAFSAYNAACRPVQAAAYLSAWLAVMMTLRRTALAGRVTSALLGFLWLWTGIVFHVIFVGAYDIRAWPIGFFFAAQGGLFLWRGAVRKKISFAPDTDGYGLIGGLILFYSLVVYPFVGLLFGAGYPDSPAAGLPPAAVVSLTLGLTLWMEDPPDASMLLVPLFAAATGSGVALTLNILEDKILFFVGLTGGLLAVMRRKMAR